MELIIIINFKTYSEGTGESALELAKVCDKVAREEKADIRVAVQAVDLREVAEAVDIPVYAQHVDPIEPGSHTGWTLPEAVREAGADGTLLNHSEHRFEDESLGETVERVKECGMEVVACAKNAEEAEFVEKTGPDFVAVEPPELIGGDISVSSARPELIEAAVEATSDDCRLLVGAGVKDGSDVEKSLELGSLGVLIASGVVKAGNPEDVLRDLANP